MKSLRGLMHVKFDTAERTVKYVFVYTDLGSSICYTSSEEIQNRAWSEGTHIEDALRTRMTGVYNGQNFF